MNRQVTSDPIRSIVNTFAQYGQPAAVDRAKALFQSVLEQRVVCAREALDAALKHYTHAATLMELDVAGALVEQAENDLDAARWMVAANRTKLPYPNHKGD